ncbi:hypothetical protein [Nonomuraea endophytica]|uniref:hypothetical protein n=1 Tax=Nonomuraea endophytica TaxID=714136 RepID=UPI0037C588DF
MTDTTVLALVGTGSLARAFCYSLAVAATSPIRVVILGRNIDKTHEAAYVSSTRAALSGAPVVFEARKSSLTSNEALAETLGQIVPNGVLVAASTQSPWERQSSPSKWTEFLEKAGFGVTLPFQAEAALRVARAAPEGTWVINACFPDAVNPLAAALDLPLWCGVGNAALLAASAQAALGLSDQRDLRMLAHHSHLYPPRDDQPEARAWLADEDREEDRELEDVGDLLAAQRAAGRAELNQVTGLAAARLVAALVAGHDVATHLPGPLGLPGGYPVHASLASGIRLRLPYGVEEKEAVEFNQRAALRDGVVVEDGRVTFAPAAREQLAAAAPDLADGFPVTDLEPVTAAFEQLRTRLRRVAANRQDTGREPA